jgi:hypothetical protein
VCVHGFQQHDLKEGRQTNHMPQTQRRSCSASCAVSTWEIRHRLRSGHDGVLDNRPDCDQAVPGAPPKKYKQRKRGWRAPAHFQPNFRLPIHRESLRSTSKPQQLLTGSGDLLPRVHDQVLSHVVWCAHPVRARCQMMLTVSIQLRQCVRFSQSRTGKITHL